MEKKRAEARDGGSPLRGVKPCLADYAASYWDFHAHHQAGRKASTVTRERTSLAQWVKKWGAVRIDKLTKPMVAAFVKDRIRDGRSPRTANLDVIVLRNLLKSAVDDGLIATLPTLGLRPLKAVAKKRPAFTAAEFNALIHATITCGKNGPQLTDYVRFLAFCGARSNEALRIKWADVDFRRKLLCIGADGSSKNSTPRYVDFNPDLERDLDEMRPGEHPIQSGCFPAPSAARKTSPQEPCGSLSNWRAIRRD